MTTYTKDELKKEIAREEELMQKLGVVVNSINENYYCELDWNKLIENKEWGFFKNVMSGNEGNKSMLIRCYEIAISSWYNRRNLDFDEIYAIKTRSASPIIPSKEVTVRVINYPEKFIMLEDIRVKHIDTIQKIKAKVTEIRDRKAKCNVILNQCPKCKKNIHVLQLVSIIKFPTRCECGYVGKFKELERNYVDIKAIKLEYDSPRGMLWIFLEKDLAFKDIKLNQEIEFLARIDTESLYTEENKERRQAIWSFECLNVYD